VAQANTIPAGEDFRFALGKIGLHGKGGPRKAESGFEVGGLV
jgi:hypothetical protein